jgi:hypothetical protein
MRQNLGGIKDRDGPLVRLCIGANHPGRTKIRCRHSSTSPLSLRDHPVDGSIQPRFGTTSILIELGSRMSMPNLFFVSKVWSGRDASTLSCSTTWCIAEHAKLGSLGRRPELREWSFVLGCFLLDEQCMFGAANGGLDREWLVYSLVIESLVVDRPALDISCVSWSVVQEPRWWIRGEGGRTGLNSEQ